MCLLPLKACFLLQVPSFLITQVRRMNEATLLLKKQLPSMKKLLRRKTLEREVRASVGQWVEPRQGSAFTSHRRMMLISTQILCKVPISRHQGCSVVWVTCFGVRVLDVSVS